jgi:ABC-2 type transport system permease protein
MNTFIWLVRREFWENKAIWIMPACIGALMLLAALFGKVEIAMLNASGPQGEAAGEWFLLAIGGVFWAAMCIYSVWYLLDCLYADRKDRSVLFFKSLPLTDSATVFSKLFVATVAIPIVYFVAADLSAVLAAFVVSVRARIGFGNILWRPELWAEQQLLWLYVVVTGILWYLPVIGWLLLVSAWAKRAVILQAIVPPLAIMLAEHLFFRTNYMSRLFAERLLGGGYVALHHPINWSASVWNLPDPVGFVSTVDVWIGVLIGAVCIAGAVQLRRRRTDA